MRTGVRVGLATTPRGGPEEASPPPAGAATEIRRAAALLREAQAIRRRLERLTAIATDAPPSSQRLLADSLDTVQRLVDDLARHQRGEQRRLQDALRRHR
jgi:hypothetical protein